VAGEPRAELLRLLVAEGQRAIEETRVTRGQERLEVVRRTSGMLKGVYWPDEFARLHEHWPT
jgi:hypothetical protein